MVILFTFLSYAAAFLTYPLVAKFSLSLNPDLTLASTIAGLMSLASLFVCPFAGVLSDRVSRKRILQLSSVCYGAVLAMHAFIRSIPALIVLRLLVGVFFSINNVTAVAYSTDFIPEKRMGEGLGYAALATILAQAIGPALGLKLVDIGGYPLVFAAAAVSVFLCAAVITFLPGRKPSGAVSGKITMDSLMAVEFTGFMILAALFAAGSGLIPGPGAKRLLGMLLKSGKKLVLDAGMLNFLTAGHRGAGDAHIMFEDEPLHENVILTPHRGELARIFGGDPAEEGESPLALASRIARASGAVVVLKGHRTVTAAPDGRIALNTTGNPGMARGGSGDVLAGTVAGLAARMNAFEAAALGVWLNGRAGDLCRDRIGETGMTPENVIDTLGEAAQSAGKGTSL